MNRTRINDVRRAGGVGLLLFAIASFAPPAAAGPKIDLPKIVVDQLPGYITIPGIGINGPVTKEQFIALSGDPVRVRAKLKGRSVGIYAHTFVRQDTGTAVIVGFQFDRPAASKGFVSGVRESAAAKGPVTPVAGLTDGGRNTQPPSEQIPAPSERVFFRAGRLGFLVTVTASLTIPQPAEEAVRVARLQRARVPKAVASERDIAERANLVWYLVVAALIVAVVWLLVRRQRKDSPPAPPAPSTPTDPSADEPPASPPDLA